MVVLKINDDDDDIMLMITNFAYLVERIENKFLCSEKCVFSYLGSRHEKDRASCLSAHYWLTNQSGNICV